MREGGEVEVMAVRKGCVGAAFFCGWRQSDSMRRVFYRARAILAVCPIPLPEPGVALFKKVRDAVRALPDGRKQGNARLCEVEEAALSALAVFFSQSPSFRDSQVRMWKHLGRNNSSSLFGVHAVSYKHL